MAVDLIVTLLIVVLIIGGIVLFSRSRGIAGWLYLPAIALVLAPVSELVSSVQLLNIVRVVAMGSTFHALILGEAAFGLAFGLFGLTVAVQFFRRKKTAPKAFAFLVALSAGFSLADGLLWSYLLDLGFLDIIENGALLGSLVGCAIWIPYMSRSKRVARTFTL